MTIEKARRFGMAVLVSLALVGMIALTFPALAQEANPGLDKIAKHIEGIYRISPVSKADGKKYLRKWPITKPVKFYVHGIKETEDNISAIGGALTFANDASDLKFEWAKANKHGVIEPDMLIVFYDNLHEAAAIPFVKGILQDDGESDEDYFKKYKTKENSVHYTSQTIVDDNGKFAGVALVHKNFLLSPKDGNQADVEYKGKIIFHQIIRLSIPFVGFSDSIEDSLFYTHQITPVYKDSGFSLVDVLLMRAIYSNTITDEMPVDEAVPIIIRLISSFYEQIVRHEKIM